MKQSPDQDRGNVPELLLVLFLLTIHVTLLVPFFGWQSATLTRIFGIVMTLSIVCLPFASLWRMWKESPRR